MPSRKHRNLATDENTDYMYDYFMNEDKVDVQMRAKLDENVSRHVNDKNLKLDSRLLSSDSGHETTEQPELPPNSSDQPRHQGGAGMGHGHRSDHRRSDHKRSEHRRSEHRRSEHRRSEHTPSENSQKSPYGRKIEAQHQSARQVRDDFSYDSEKGYDNDNDYAQDYDEPDAGGPADNPRLNESLEDRRARATTNLAELQILVEKHGVQLTREYTRHDDPDEMEAEIKIHKERRNKENQVKFYKRILLNVCCGAEFLNEKYNPFEFKLKDWSKSMASDMDDYTEVLEEIYEKYKGTGGKFSPEIRLLFMILMSGVFFHISQTLFGAEGLGKAVQSNPNVMTKIMGGLMGGKAGGLASMFGGGAGADEPAPSREQAPSHRDTLSMIRLQQQARNQAGGAGAAGASSTASTSASAPPDIKPEAVPVLDANIITQRELEAREALAIEREKRREAETRAAFEGQLRHQSEMHAAQLNGLRDRMTAQAQARRTTEQSDRAPYRTQQSERAPVPVVLSDASKGPRFRSNPLFANNMFSHMQQRPTASPSERSPMFETGDDDIMPSSSLSPNSDSGSSPRPRARYSSPSPNPKPRSKTNFQSISDVIDSLGESSSDIDLDFEPSPKPKPKPVTTARKPRARASVTRSAARSTGRTETSASKRGGNVIKL